MKTFEDHQIDVPFTNKWELTNEPVINAVSKIGNYLKKFMYMTGFAGIALCFSACVPGYIATEPAYVENIRPLQPSPLHIWIDGDWLFNRQSHTYVQKVGYWEKPNQHRTYVSGHWQKSPRGNYWTAGHWQRQGH